MTETQKNYAGAKRQARKLAKTVVKRDEHFTLHEYPDYETYKTVQVAGNKAKLGMQHVQESHISALAAHLNDAGHTVSFGLCHGTRQGREQSWFRKHLNGDANVIGTEISDTADQFAHTVQWDFHDPNPDWAGHADLIYSNSWDHAYDPSKAFGNWIDALRAGGVMLLDYTAGHTPRAASALDPFGITQEALIDMLTREFSALGEVEQVLDFTQNPDYRAHTVVFRRHAA